MKQITSFLLATLFLLPASAASGELPSLPGDQSSWNGFEQFDFELDGVACRVVQPIQAAAGKPWIWRARFWGHEPQTDIALLKLGFHVAYCDVANLWGNDIAINRWDRFYEEMTCRYGLSSQPALEGMSRGGLIIYRWAIKHPQQVSCLYADAPAMGIRPYVKGLSDGDPELDQLKDWMQAHNLTLAEAQQFTGDALDQLAPLARAGVPLIHVCGDADESVPFEDHTAQLEKRYRALGGTINVIVKPGGKHHPHSLPDPSPIVDFIVRHQSRVSVPITHGPFIGHLTARSAQVWARSEDATELRLTVRDWQGRLASSVTASSTPSNDGCLVWHIKNLRPATRYQLQILRSGQKLIAGNDHFFTTPQRNSAHAIQLAFASCARVDDSSSAVWRRIQSVDPEAVVLLGDTPYIDTTELAEQRRRYREFNGVTDFQKLFSHRSLYATWDDHDFGRNDTDGNLPGKENSRRAFIEYHANPSYGNGSTGIYSRFRRGPVEVFLLDTRYFAATEPSPFDSDKPSLLGRHQWDWLLDGLETSTAAFKVVACGMIWNGAVRPGKQDHWATYPHERQALFDHIGRHNISGLLLVGGDIHRTRVLHHDTVKSAGYKIPELITSPVHSGVIETANALHPGLIFDAGAPNVFLLISAQGKGRSASLQATFLNKDGTTLYQDQFGYHDLRRP
jgi:alkaline phosphatase D